MISTIPGGAWRRALMVNTACSLIYMDRQAAFEENPSDEFLQKRYSHAIYSLALNMGWYGAKFNAWVTRNVSKSKQRFWYEMVLEAHNLNKVD